MATNMLPYQLSNQQYSQLNNSPLSNLTNQQQTTPVMFGRIVNDAKEIRPNEVPMNGLVSFFPKADYSEVYARSWNSNGTIDAVTYVPVSTSSQTMEMLLVEMNKRLDTIESMLNRKQHNNQQRQKKVGENND